ncbi:PfkB family carbohydrate kinase [Chitinophagaceae bacterium MMS25-I14]
MNHKVLCFGEILMRISPAPHGQWINAAALPVYIGGAEANVAVALANWDVPVKYSTAMPDNYVGHDIDRYLQEKGIDTTAIVWSGNRVGTYYMQQGADLKHAGVIYDRFYSSFYDLKPGTINWDKALEDVHWFHLSAISPALNADVAAVCLEAIQAAAAKGITISIDLNYRAKLWQYGKKPSEVMPELVKYCDLVMGNIWAAETLLGIPVDAAVANASTQADYLALAEETVAEIYHRYPKCKTVANTFRFDNGVDGIHYYSTIAYDGKSYHSPEFSAAGIKDKAGSGDCFMAGLIHGIYNGNDMQDTINFGAAAAFGKLQEIGDSTKQSVNDVQTILKHYGQENRIA